MRIVNLVCSGDLKTIIDLEEIRKSGNNLFTYDPSKYHGGYISLSNCKAVIYKSGKYIIVGLKSPNEVESAFFELKNFLSKFVDTSKAEKPKIMNMVAVGDLQTNIDLNKFSLILGLENVEYEPEQFPGLVYRYNKLTALVFSSGKVVLTGARDINVLEVFFYHIKKLVIEIKYLEFG